MKIRHAVPLAMLLSLLFSSVSFSKNNGQDLNKEIYYQILVRSFYDANGDGIGDLKGLKQKLDYLQELGITSIWIMPVFASPTYFNYYADDFFKVDPELGTMDDFRSLCTEIHKRGMKILLDMETQYITKNNEIYTKALADPKSEYNEYFEWQDRDEEMTYPAFGGLAENTGFDGVRVGILPLNLNSKKVLDLQKKIYSFWLDPNGDGNLSDGVDGYRMDHIMDDLDNKGMYSDLLSGFWRPVVDYTRKIKPDVIYLVEPADWGAKWDDLLPETGMDAAFNIPLRSAITLMARDNVIDFGIKAVAAGAKGKYSFTILENHDNNRFASDASSNQAALRLGAALNITLPGVPCLYYGQELGTKGERIEGGSDGNDIPNREAFRWFRDWKKKGMAVWYKISDDPETEDVEGEFWADAYVKKNDGTTLEDQINDPKSLYNFYKKIISLRRNSPTLQTGETKLIEIADEELMAFARLGDEKFVIIANFSDGEKNAKINLAKAGIKAGEYSDLAGDGKISVKDAANFTIKLSPYQVIILK